MTGLRPSLFLTILILGSVTALTPLAVDMYLPAFEAIAADLGTGISKVELSLTVFFIGLAVGQLFYGPFADRFGRKLPLNIGLLLAAFASLACVFVTDIDYLIIFRFLQATGICAGAVIARAMVRDMYEPREAARFFSLLMLVMGVAPILAPVAGGFVTQYFGWQAIFLFISAMAFLCLVAVNLSLPETHAANPGVRLSRAAHTYFDILKNRAFVHYTLAGGFAQAGMFAYITGSPFVLMTYFGIEPQYYGIIFGSNAFGMIAMTQLNRYLLKHYSFNQILKVAFSLILLSGLILLISGLSEPGLVATVIPLFFYVTTLGMVMPNTMASALAEEGARAGSASALAGSLQFAIAFLSSGAIGMIQATSPLTLMLVMTACAFLSFATAWRQVFTRKT